MDFTTECFTFAAGQSRTVNPKMKKVPGDSFKGSLKWKTGRTFWNSSRKDKLDH